MIISLHPFHDNDPWHLPLLLVFFTASTGIWLYSFSRWKNLLVSIYCFYLEQTDPADAGPDLKGNEPHVTIQICTYNEAQVVEETIARCCKLDWPRDKLTIQICDDSTEKESIAIIENCVFNWREEGFSVTRLERPDRIGFKAGNLNHNFPFIEGDFVAYLDADHQVTADFLRKTAPHFFYADGGSKGHIGLVQAPWSYYNTHENLLTECDALGLDIHHVVEQVGRHRIHRIFGFNGTGGVWRKEAIRAVGLFSWDTVTEDLLLSYKAYLGGYDFHYVRTVPQQLEVPGCFLAHIQQKQRWTKGFIQVLRMFYGEILFSPQTPFQVKLEAFLHLCGPLQLIMTAFVLIVYPHLVYHQIDSFMVRVVSVSAIIEPVASAFHAIINKVPGENGNYGAWWSRLLRVYIVLPYFALRFGMSAFEVKAILEGLFSDDATFLVTPKAGSKQNVCERTKARKIKISATDDFAAFAGLLLAFHQTVYVFALDGRVPVFTSFDVFIRAMNLVICVGLYWVNLSFLFSKHCNHVERFRASLSQPKQSFFAVMMVIVVNYFMVMIYLQASDSVDDSIHLLGDFSVHLHEPPAAMNEKAASSISWACPVRENVTVNAREALLVFGEPCTGSNLFFDVLDRLQYYSQEDLNIRTMHELYTHDEAEQVRLLRRCVNAMFEGCDLPVYIDGEDETWRYSTTQEFFARLLEESGRKLSTPYLQLMHIFDNRYNHPTDWVDFISSIPSTSIHPIFAFKVFHEHLEELSMSAVQFTKSLQRVESVPIVLWRRRIIESFVSYKNALKKNAWFGESSTSKDTVRVEKHELELFVNEKRRYYESIRDSFAANGIEIDVFEYRRDLSNREVQLSTVKRLQERLEVIGDSIAEQIVDEIIMKKQAQVPLNQQIENWDEVISWGYGGDAQDWEDIFADS